MIEGLRLDFTSAELRDHLTARADFHAGKVQWYADQAASLRQGMAHEANVTNDPISSLQRSRDDHAGKAAFFRVLAEHLVPNETYRLTETDLTRIEVYSRWF